MKRIIRLSLVILFGITLTGCLREDKLTNDNVYTTIYPIEYLTNYLYGEEKSVASIYPSNVDVTSYELTNKQKETYYRGALFVYNGLTGEKELAKEFLNNNKDLLLIDVSYGLNYDNTIEELWLSPNNYLMLAKNIKNNLIDYTTSKTVIDKIENKYKELEETLSYLDADLRSIASSANFDGNPVLIASSNKLKFLEKYGFQVLVIDNDISEANLKSNFRNQKYKDIYLCGNDAKTELINELEESYKANIINVNMLYTLSDNEVATNENYVTLMEEFIENIRNTTLG
ncbi:MAG: metal ABC transporter substrate-binding protein [Ruminococcus sp.]|nr:metal ABC transporter substrate-binding protein [Ruminococcus sp.]